MATLVVKNSKDDSFSPNPSDEKKRRKTEKRLEKEYARVRANFEEVRQAFTYVENAGSRDDIHFRLLQLEKTTHRVRTGGLFAHGAKLHRRLLRSLQKSSIE
ncbi:MAG TPA: hypothetical protein PKB15_07735 [Acidimicrobiia bacterium]|nr:hypothetical protein [Acidimicrobiia bacterium]